MLYVGLSDIRAASSCLCHVYFVGGFLVPSHIKCTYLLDFLVPTDLIVIFLLYLKMYICTYFVRFDETVVRIGNALGKGV